MKTVQELRKAAYKVRVTHYRYVNSSPRMLLPTFVIRMNGLQNLIEAKGGKTVVEVFNGLTLYRGISECSQDDSFNTKEGVRIALERAWGELRQNTFLNVDDALTAITKKGSKFFSLEFKKRGDGTIRRMNAKFSSKSTINKGTKLITLWDLKKKDFRSVPLDAIIEVK